MFSQKHLLTKLDVRNVVEIIEKGYKLCKYKFKEGIMKDQIKSFTPIESRHVMQVLKNMLINVRLMNNEFYNSGKGIVNVIYVK